jgi:hypothetical protein
MIAHVDQRLMDQSQGASQDGKPGAFFTLTVPPWRQSLGLQTDRNPAILSLGKGATQGGEEVDALVEAYLNPGIFLRVQIGKRAIHIRPQRRCIRRIRTA